MMRLWPMVPAGPVEKEIGSGIHSVFEHKVREENC